MGESKLKGMGPLYHLHNSITVQCAQFICQYVHGLIDINAHIDSFKVLLKAWILPL